MENCCGVPHWRYREGVYVEKVSCGNGIENRIYAIPITIFIVNLNGKYIQSVEYSYQICVVLCQNKNFNILTAKNVFLKSLKKHIQFALLNYLNIYIKNIIEYLNTYRIFCISLVINFIHISNINKYCSCLLC